MKLSIVVPIYILDQKLADLTFKCIESIVKYTKDYELIIVDNKPNAIIGGQSSMDQFVPLADIYIANEKNVGNGEAWNQGAAVANGKYICFMDNDVEVHKKWSEPLIEILENKKNGVAFPLSKNKEDDDYFERLAGFCWVVRKATFKRLGRIKSKIYGIANFEDTHFFMKAKKKGYLLKCSKDSKVDHYSRATCDKVPEVQKIYKRNEKRYFDKFGILPMLD